MIASDIIFQRLHNQRLAQTKFQTPSEVVSWLGAVQSQDYAGAKWAVAQRTTGITDTAIEEAFTDGAILRTHVMRPTWHFVTPADIRWMLELTAPRVHARNAYAYRQFELDDAIFAQSNAALVDALQGGKQLTRAELVVVLQQAGIDTGDLLRSNHLIIHAELDGIVCSGGRQGKQFTYALLEERAPQARRLEHDEALAELAKRYFQSHGPATLKDYVWWSGLTVADAKAGLEMVKPQLIHEAVDDQTYWFAASVSTPDEQTPAAYLLPNFDEYLVGYTDRSALFDASHTEKLDLRGNFLFNHTIVMEGQVVGTWKRTFKKGAVVITSTPFTAFTDAENDAFTAAAHRYGEFLGMQEVLS